MSNLASQLAAAEKEDVARGIRHLLAAPILHERAQPEQFTTIRARRGPITQWFEYYCGWRLVVEPRLGYARLAKVRGDVLGVRPARRLRSGRAPFDRRRYVLLCVAAAELLSTPVTTVGLLAERITRATAADPVVGSFDSAAHGERKAFVDALRLLEHLGALQATDGTTESYVESAEAKVLYRVDTTLLLRLLSAPQGPSRVAFPTDDDGRLADRFDDLLAALTAETRYGGPEPRTRSGSMSPYDGPPSASPESRISDAQRNLGLRHAVFRRLVDDPVLYRAEMTDAELGYVGSPTGRRVMREGAERAGMVLEERAEGWLLVDPDAIATDQRFPDDGHAGTAALVLLDRLVATPQGLTEEQVVVEADAVLRREPSWARAYRTDDGAHRLAGDAVAVLLAFGLAGRTDGVVRAWPAAARYALAQVTVRTGPGST